MEENRSGMDNTVNRKKRLKELLNIGGQIRNTKEVEDNLLTVAKITNIIEETDSINRHGDFKERATNTTEIVMDAEVIQMGHELIGEVMQNTDNAEFSDDEWINAIIGLVYKDDNESWCQLSKLICRIPKIAKCSSCLLGGFDLLDVSQNPEHERQRRSRNNKNDELKPLNVSQIDKRDGNTQSVSLIYRKILKLFVDNNRIPLPYYKLIIEPNNFMKTVDNAFKVAFLARDKFVAIEMNDDNVPYIKPLTKQNSPDSANETTQTISSLNLKIYRDMIEKYQIKESMLSLQE